MKVRANKGRLAEAQIAYARAQESTGQAIADIYRRRGVSEQPFYRWTKEFGSMGVMEVRRMKQLEEANSTLKWMHPDLSLGKAIRRTCCRSGRGSTESATRGMWAWRLL